MATAWIEKHVDRRGRARLRVRGKAQGVVESVGLYDDPDKAERVRLAWLDRHGGDDTAHTLGSFGLTWLRLRETDGAHRSAKVDRQRWMRHVHADAISTVALTRLSTRHVAAWADRLVRRTPVRAITRGVGDARKTEHRDRTGQRLSRQTVRHIWRLLAVCLRAAVERGLIDASPLASMRCPDVIDTPRDREEYVEQRAIDALLALPVTRELRREADGTEAKHITPAERSACLVAVYAGLRAGELWGLRWCDVRLDGDRPELHVRRSRGGRTKTLRERRVRLLPPAVEALRAWREVRPGVGEALVWPSDGSGSEAQRARVRGGPHGRGYDAGWGRIRALIGTTVRWHDLRHTCASHLVMGTWTARPLELIEVRDWLGHASIRTTERYAHLRPGGVHDIAYTPPAPHQAAVQASVTPIAKARKRKEK